MMFDTRQESAAQPAVRIKICGLFRTADIDYVNEALPDFAGFVFAPSRRQITPAFAARLRSTLNAAIVPVGVFVRAAPRDVAALYHDGVIAAAQLHGGEDSAYIAGLKKLCAIPVIQALGGEQAWSAAPQADYLLFDNERAGSGERFDWQPLRKRPLSQRPLSQRALDNHPLDKPWFLAGGINEDTIDEALTLRPFALDVSSGAESGGLKDRAKILRLVEKTRNFCG